MKNKLSPRKKSPKNVLKENIRQSRNIIKEFFNKNQTSK